MDGAIVKLLLLIPVVAYILFAYINREKHTLKSQQRTANNQSSHALESSTVTSESSEPIVSRLFLQNSPYDSDAKYINNKGFMFNCSNIHRINIQKRLGFGISKQGYLGYYNGKKVVVKITEPFADEIRQCMDQVKKLPIMQNKCALMPRTKIMNEILLLHEISHPNIAQLLGYCVRSGHTEPGNVTQHSVISVTEWGETINPNAVFALPWTLRLKFALDLAELANFLEHSQFGSIIYPDFKLEHFKIFGVTIKVIDLDMIYNQELGCSLKHPCSYGLKCVYGACFGFNAKYNLYRMNEFFSQMLLQFQTYPKELAGDIIYLNSTWGHTDINANELVKAIKRIRQKATDLGLLK